MAKISLLRTGDITVAIGAFSANPGININTSLRELARGFFKRKKPRVRLNVRPILKAIAVRRVDVGISMPDAFYTAMTCGAVSCALEALEPKSASVKPLFNENGTFVSFTCIISLTLGKAVVTAINLALGAIKERIENGSAGKN